MKLRVHICAFTVGIDELPRRKQRAPIEVARVLAQHRRFSVFEATANQTIARTMDKIGRSGWFVFSDHGFPWTGATLTDAGRTAIGRRVRCDRRHKRGMAANACCVAAGKAGEP